MTTASAIPGSSRVIHRVAIVDIGTNTIKFSLFEVPDDGTPRLLASDAETVRLGADIDETGKIGGDRQERATTALRRFELAALNLSADTLIGVATEAFRAARNGSEVLASIHAATGWRLRVIDGLEEARLTFQGLQSQLERFQACVVADVGGGSTELLHVSSGSLLQSVSVPIGSGRFTDRYFPGGRLSQQHFDDARSAARRALEPALPAGASRLPLVLSGGNGLFLQRLGVMITRYRQLTVDALEDVARDLVTRPPEAIARMLSISTERAGVLPAGCAISLGAIDAIEPLEIAAVPSGIREGVLRDWLDQQGVRSPESCGDRLAEQVD